MMFVRSNFTEGKIIAFSVIVMIIVLIISMILIGQGTVRHVPITFKEVIKATVAFKKIDGNVKVVGLVGNTGINPTLLSRTGETEYSLTVINGDIDIHMFYIEGLNVHTKLLRYGQNDTITIQPDTQGIYNYYDRFSTDKINGSIIPIGQFKTLKVAGDKEYK